MTELANDLLQSKVTALENDIVALKRQLENCINNDKEALAEQLRVKKRKLESIIEYKTKGAIIRSKARWYNEGEKNNKNTLGLENRYCIKKKTIMQIKEKDGANLTNDSDINRTFGEICFGYEHHKLNEMDKKKCKGLLTEKNV